MACDTALLKYRFDLGEEVVLTSPLAGGCQYTGGNDEEHRKEAHDHGPSITT
jgi:hypothetical protein